MAKSYFKKALIIPIIVIFLFGCVATSIPNSKVPTSQKPSKIVRSEASPPSLDAFNFHFSAAGVYEGKISHQSAFFNRDNNLVIPIEYTHPYPKEGVSLGQGWSLIGSKKSSSLCIDFQASSAGGQDAKVEYIKINSTAQLKRALDTSSTVSAKASIGDFGASASGKYSFARRIDIESSFDSHLLKAYVVDGVEYVSPLGNDRRDATSIVLTSFAKQLLAEPGGILKFREYCGDTFVSSIERGAEMYLVMRKTQHKDAQKITTESSYSASGSYFGFSAEGSTNTKSMEEFLENNSESTFNYYHVAHKGVYIPAGIKEVPNALRQLGDSSDINKSFPLNITLTSYSYLPEYRDILLNEPKITIDRMQSYVERLNSIVNRLNHMLEFTLVNNSDSSKQCKLDNPATCVRLSNLQLYYEPVAKPKDNDPDSKFSSQDVARFEDLRSLVSKDIVKVNSFISHCLKIPEDQNNCLQRYDGKYNDYFYLALLPLPANKQLYTDAKSANAATLVENEISKLESALPQTISRRWKTDRCGILKTNCRTTNYTKNCSEEPNGAPCVRLRNKIKSLQLDLASLNSKVKESLPHIRFNYLINDILVQRHYLDMIDHKLTDEQKLYFKQDILCQWDNAIRDCDKHQSIYSLLSESRAPLQFVYNFDIDKFKSKISGLADAANDFKLDKANQIRSAFIVKEDIKNLSSETLCDSKGSTSLPCHLAIEAEGFESLEQYYFNLVNVVGTSIFGQDFDSGTVSISALEDYKKLAKFLLQDLIMITPKKYAPSKINIEANFPLFSLEEDLTLEISPY